MLGMFLTVLRNLRCIWEHMCGILGDLGQWVFVCLLRGQPPLGSQGKPKWGPTVAKNWNNLKQKHTNNNTNMYGKQPSKTLKTKLILKIVWNQKGHWIPKALICLKLTLAQGIPWLGRFIGYQKARKQIFGPTFFRTWKKTRKHIQNVDPKVTQNHPKTLLKVNL